MEDRNLKKSQKVEYKMEDRNLKHKGGEWSDLLTVYGNNGVLTCY